MAYPWRFLILKTSTSLSILRPVKNELSEKGIFKYGNYGWLGRYRANSIISAIKRQYKDFRCSLIIPLEIFHACYLLNTEQKPNVSHFLTMLVEPILKDSKLRVMTVAEDMLSRIFTIKYLLELKKQINKKLSENGSKDKDLSDFFQHICNAFSNANGNDKLDGHLNVASRTVKEKLKKTINDSFEIAKKETENMKAYIGIKKGVGHSVTFDEILNLNFTVDVKKLFEIFTDISTLVEKHRIESNIGECSGVKYGRNISKMTPTALSLPDEVFWYRFASSTLPITETSSTRMEDFILVVDKSDSMNEKNKTLWSRAVALTLAKLASKGSINAKLIFFDSNVYPNRPIDLGKRFNEALKTILTLKCEGGTDIDNVLRQVDKYKSTIILITDGEDEVTYKPKSKLISIMIEGENETLKENSNKYLSVKPTKEGALKIFEQIR